MAHHWKGWANQSQVKLQRAQKRLRQLWSTSRQLMTQRPRITLEWQEQSSWARVRNLEEKTWMRSKKTINQRLSRWLGRAWVMVMTRISMLKGDKRSSSKLTTLRSMTGQKRSSTSYAKSTHWSMLSANWLDRRRSLSSARMSWKSDLVEILTVSKTKQASVAKFPKGCAFATRRTRHNRRHKYEKLISKLTTN